jgi:hypothetical protein
MVITIYNIIRVPFLQISSILHQRDNFSCNENGLVGSSSDPLENKLTNGVWVLPLSRPPKELDIITVEKRIRGCVQW